MSRESISVSIFPSAVFKGEHSAWTKVIRGIACAVLANLAAVANPPAYPTDVKPYQIIAFEQPNFVGSYRAFVISPGFTMAQVHKLDAFKDNIRSVLVGDKVGVVFYVDEDFRGSRATVLKSARDFKQLPSEVVQAIRIEHKIKSLIVFQKEHSSLQGVTLFGHDGGAQFFPAEASGKGTASYPQISFNDKAASISLTESWEDPGSPAHPILSVELFEHKDFKGDWVRFPGATESAPQSSYRLDEYKFNKKTSSLKITYLKAVPGSPEHELEAGIATLKPPSAQVQPLHPTSPTNPVISTEPVKPLKPVTLPKLQTQPSQESSTEGSLRFNPATLEIAEFKGRWAIVDHADPSQTAIAYFKPDRKADAEQAVRVLQHYGINQKEVLGDSGFAFFLVSGKAPEGEFPGEKCQVFDPQTITVEQRSITSKTDPSQVMGSYWAIMSGPKQLWGFRNDEPRAREVRMFIRQYGFTRLCNIGGFVYWHK